MTAPFLNMLEGTKPATPSTNQWRAYFKTDGLYIVDDVGNEIGPLIKDAPSDGSQYARKNAAWEAVAASGGGGDVIRTKYIITPSILSNNLVFALKYIDGNDCTSTNKLTFRVGNTEYNLTAAMSFTKNAGTNLCNAGSAELKTKDVDFFVYAIGETGASAGLKFGYSRFPNARFIGDFVNTATDEKYIAGNWTNFNATDPVANIGRFRAQNSGTASYNWSIPTALVVNRPIYETGILTWQPVYSASGSMTWTSVSTNLAEYQIIGNQCFVEVYASGTTGGSASNALNLTLPFNARNVSQYVGLYARVADGAAALAAIAYTNAGTPNILSSQKYDGSNFGLGVTRYTSANGKYMI